MDTVTYPERITIVSHSIVSFARSLVRCDTVRLGSKRGAHDSTYSHACRERGALWSLLLLLLTTRHLKILGASSCALRVRANHGNLALAGSLHFGSSERQQRRQRTRGAGGMRVRLELHQLARYRAGYLRCWCVYAAVSIET